jgi:hypothetical protein
MKYLFEATIKNEETDETISRVFAGDLDGLLMEIGKRKFSGAVEKHSKDKEVERIYENEEFLDFLSVKYSENFGNGDETETDRDNWIECFTREELFDWYNKFLLEREKRKGLLKKEFEESWFGKVEKEIKASLDSLKIR